MITIETTVDGTENKTLTYYSKALIDELSKKYEEIKDVHPHYASTMKDFIETTYTDGAGENGSISVPTFSVTSTTTVYKYGSDIKGKEEKSTENGMTYITVNYDVVSSKYGTPVEFLVDLLEITGSQDFVNAFIAEVTKPEYKITLGLYDLTTTTTSVNQESYKQKTDLISHIQERNYYVMDIGKRSVTDVLEGTGISTGGTTGAPYRDPTSGITDITDIVPVKVNHTETKSTNER